MTRLLLIVLLLISSNLYSQNWNLITTGTYFHFADSSGNYATTVKTDSFSLNNTDTIFYLNRIVTDCDTCSNNPNNEFILKNQGTFLQKEVLKTGNVYWFHSPKSFVLKPLSGIGGSWLMDTLNNITATVIGINPQTTFGISDSVKEIQLSNQQILRISKNFGILELPINTDLTYSLIGTESFNTYGFRLPKFRDFFDFNLGDVFQYQSGSYGNGNTEESRYKHTVISKSDYIDSLKYIIRVNGIRSYFDVNSAPLGTSYVNDTIIVTYNDSISHFANGYNGELTLNFFDDYSNYSRVNVTTEDGLITKEIGFNTDIPIYSYYEQDATHNDLFRFTSGNGIESKRIIKTGLAYVEFIADGGLASSGERLMGYVKNGDTTGTVYNDYILSNKDKNHPSITQVYPNPVIENLYVSIDNDVLKEIVIYDATGRKIKETLTKERLIEIQDLKKGFYLLQINSGEEKIIQKIIVN